MIYTSSSAHWQQATKLLALRRFGLIWKDWDTFLSLEQVSWGGVPRTQKLRSPWWEPKCCQRIPLSETRVGQSIALHAALADRTSTCLVSAFPIHSNFIWPEGRPGSSDVSPLSGISGMSFDSVFLSALLLFCLALFLNLSTLFFCCIWPSLLLIPSEKFFTLFFF